MVRMFGPCYSADNHTLVAVSGLPCVVHLIVYAYLWTQATPTRLRRFVGRGCLAMWPIWANVKTCESLEMANLSSLSSKPLILCGTHQPGSCNTSFIQCAWTSPVKSASLLVTAAKGPSNFSSARIRSGNHADVASDKGYTISFELYPLRLIVVCILSLLYYF